MGKTTKPLYFLVHPALSGVEETFNDLVAQGHTVHYMADPLARRPLALEEYDLILGPTSWRMTPALLKYLDLAMKAARKEWKKR